MAGLPDYVIESNIDKELYMTTLASHSYASIALEEAKMVQTIAQNGLNKKSFREKRIYYPR